MRNVQPWSVGALGFGVCCLSLPATDGAVGVGDVVAGVSQSEYTVYQLAIENMGLGLYGGPAYDQGVRNRDGWDGPGTRGNQEARLYLNDTLDAMGLNVSIQGSYSNVVAELPGWETPEKVYIVCGHCDHVGGDRPGGDDDDDLSGLLSNWETGTDWCVGDFTGDDAVDNDDLSRLLSNWMGSASAEATVPEPTSLALWVIGAMGLLRWGR